MKQSPAEQLNHWRRISPDDVPFLYGARYSNAGKVTENLKEVWGLENFPGYYVEWSRKKVKTEQLERLLESPVSSIVDLVDYPAESWDNRLQEIEKAQNRCFNTSNLIELNRRMNHRLSRDESSREAVSWFLKEAGDAPNECADHLEEVVAELGDLAFNKKECLAKDPEGLTELIEVGKKFTSLTHLRMDSTPGYFHMALIAKPSNNLPALQVEDVHAENLTSKIHSRLSGFIGNGSLTEGSRGSAAILRLAASEVPYLSLEVARSVGEVLERMEALEKIGKPNGN